MPRRAIFPRSMRAVRRFRQKGRIMTVLSLDQASGIVDASLSKARELKLRALTVTVLDPGGHPIVVKREDGCGILRPQIAHAKAWGCLGTGHGGAAGARHADRDPALAWA